MIRMLVRRSSSAGSLTSPFASTQTWRGELPRARGFFVRYLFTLLLLAGCATSNRTTDQSTTDRSGKWGYYSGTIETRWEDDGRTMTLLSELIYTDPDGVVWVAPKGAKVDGASIPRALWSLMGGPFEGRYRNASVLHDVAYDEKRRPWQDADRMFYNAMRCSGVSAVEAKTMYYALYRHGRHWKFSVKKAKPVEPGEITEVRRATPITAGEVDAAEQWIKENNPTLKQIEAKADAETH
jgi:hypothetical protein